MALVVICGQPCSGKSTCARFLVEALAESDPKPNTRIIDEVSFHLDRNQCYADMPAEKNLRGMLRSEVDRSVSKDSVTIVDSLNNIKGYRYELWCLARAAGVLYCVLYCDVEDLQCRKWNTDRRDVGGGSSGTDAYSDAVIEDLLRRFEKPDGRNRWDAPLFELRPSRDGIGKSSGAIAAAVEYLTKKVDPKTWNTRALQPTIATQGVPVSGANSLYEMDRATLDVVNAVAEAQRLPVGGSGRVWVGEGLPSVNVCGGPVSLTELRRLRRTFIKLAGQSSLSGAPPPSDAYSAKRMFVDYLNRELRV